MNAIAGVRSRVNGRRTELVCASRKWIALGAGFRSDCVDAYGRKLRASHVAYTPQYGRVMRAVGKAMKAGAAVDLRAELCNQDKEPLAGTTYELLHIVITWPPLTPRQRSN